MLAKIKDSEKYSGYIMEMEEIVDYLAKIAENVEKIAEKVEKIAEKVER